jgi:diguanylate cyclase (GGDEF)-like protein
MLPTEKGSALKVLIVDDDVVDREMIKRYLSKSKLCCDIVESSSVDEGLALYDQHKFDVVLLDYRMPQRDGIEMILELRTHTRNYGTAIVMMSSAEDEKLAIDSLEAGAQDFIPKSDISARRIKNALVHAQTRYRLENELRQSYLKSKDLAEKDTLTGLSNRFVFEDALQVAIKRNITHKLKLGLLIIGIDKFQVINDMHGHDIGDLLLKKFSKRIQECLESEALFSRLGGDEFSVLVANLKSEGQLGSIASRIIRNLEKPICVNSLEFKINISVGMALHPDSSSDPIELLKCADIAMYRAKATTGSLALYFYQEMQDDFIRHHGLSKSINSGLDENRFHLVYQPVINPITNELKGFEALLRHTSSSGELIPPDEFIPIAEQNGAIIGIGEWVLKESMAQLKYWKKNYYNSLRLAINVSPVQLKSDKLIMLLKECIQIYDLDASDIEIELTETAILTLDKVTLDSINAMKEIGVRLSLDDFGTGYSSISHLLSLPINTVKIDKSILPVQADSPGAIRLLNAMVTLVDNLGLDIIVEGVETSFQQELVIKNKVSAAQGYFYDKPLSVEEVDSKYMVK